MIAFIRRLFFNDMGLKLFSVLLAFLLWFTVSFAIRNRIPPAAPGVILAERTFTELPVVVMSSASDVRSFRVEPQQVEVVVQGDSAILNNLRDEDIKVRVDLTGIESAQSLTKRIEVATPIGVTPTQIRPENVRVVFPRRN